MRRGRLLDSRAAVRASAGVHQRGDTNELRTVHSV